MAPQSRGGIAPARLCGFYQASQAQCPPYEAPLRISAADAVLAADMGAGQPAVVADDVDQRAPRFGAHRVVATIDVERDVEFIGHGLQPNAWSFRGAGASRRARNP